MVSNVPSGVDGIVESFRNKRVLVTGHTGFKGAWLCEWLLRMDATVAGYALEPQTQPSLFKSLGLAARVHHYVGDVADGERLAQLVHDFQPDAVFHMAAQSLVGLSFSEPRATFETNVMGTVNILEALRSGGRPCAVIIVTSDKCYRPWPTPRHHEEGDALGGRDPYSASKAATEIAAAAWRDSFFPKNEFSRHGVLVATVRAGNVIGGGDWAADRLVPDVVRAISEGTTVVLRNPRAVRPWQHVLDALSGYLLLASKLTTGEDTDLAAAFNFGPSGTREIPVLVLTNEFLKAWGKAPITTTGDRGSEWKELPHLALSVEKAKAVLDWTPRYTVSQAVQATVEWYRQFYRGADARNITAQQLEAYLTIAPAGVSVHTGSESE